MRTYGQKHIGDLFQREYSVDKTQETDFQHWVNKTAKLIGRSYVQTFKLMEDWPMAKIRQRYLECTNHCPPHTKPHIRWWALRKRDKNETKDFNKSG